MYLTRSIWYRYSLCAISMLTTLLLAACGPASGTPVSGGSATNGPAPIGSVSSAPTATQETSAPSTSTATSVQPCPASAGAVNVAMMPALHAGSTSNLVYRVNEFQGQTPNFGTLRRYDALTGTKTDIVRLGDMYISEAVISTDGQWILFVSIDQKRNYLQLVRVDGQNLQTLYCAKNLQIGSALPPAVISSVRWSPNQQVAAFDEALESDPLSQNLMFLDVKQGNIGSVLKPCCGYRPFPTPAIWLDNRFIYLQMPGVDRPSPGIYLFDMTLGPRQFMGGNVQNVIGGGDCADVALSADKSRLFLSNCMSIPNPNGPYFVGQRGPGTIKATAEGGGQIVLYSNAVGAITHIRAATATTLLLTVNTSAQGVKVDSSQNGLWKINTDGTGLVLLTKIIALDSAESGLNTNSEDPWSNVSRDGSLYSLQNLPEGQGTQSAVLSIGSMQGGAPKVIASISDGTQLAIVGWTVL